MFSVVGSVLSDDDAHITHQSLMGLLSAECEPPAGNKLHHHPTHLPVVLECVTTVVHIQPSLLGVPISFQCVLPCLISLLQLC